jgi:hypothetical protein
LAAPTSRLNSILGYIIFDDSLYRLSFKSLNLPSSLYWVNSMRSPHIAAGITSFFLIQALFTTERAEALILNVNGVETTAFAATAVEFNLISLNFGGATPENPEIITIKPSGTKDVFSLLITGDGIKKDTGPLKIEGTLGQMKFLGGKVLMDIPWWDFTLTVNLNDSVLGIFQNYDQISIENASIRHLIGPHEGDEELGLDLGWKNLNLSADPGKAKNSVQEISLPHPFPCKQHPGNEPPHVDCITSASLSANINDGFLVNDITSWKFEVSAIHDVPAPMPILGIGAALSAARKLRRRINQIKSLNE